ncbi:MAG: hypothetical protein ACOCYE_03215 [Pseudomonadota bacterium]
MEPSTTAELQRLAAGLGRVLRRDAEALETDAAADLEALAGQLDALLALAAAHPDDPQAARALLHVLSEVEAFHARVVRAHAHTREALLGAAERGAASRAYGHARRYAAGGAVS